MTEVRVARLDDIPAGRPTRVEAEGTSLVLARVGETIHALDDTCAHRGGPLGDGRLTGTRLACPWHGWMYDVRTGRCLFPTRGGPVASYPVRIAGGEVWVDLP